MIRMAISSLFAIVAATFSIAAQSRPSRPEAAIPPFNIVEATIPQMQAAMKAGRLTSHELVLQYLARIGMYEEKLHAAVYVNPDALKDADARDREHRAPSSNKTYSDRTLELDTMPMKASAS
jgi:amidase